MSQSRPPQPTGPLNKAIRDRQREVARQTAEMRKVPATTASEPTRQPPPPSVKQPAMPPPPNKRATQPIDFEQPITQAIDTIQDKAGWTRGQMRTALLGAGVITLLCLILGFFAVGQSLAGTSTATPTAIPLPLMTASDVVAQLKKAGLSVTNAQSMKMPNAIWQATQQLQISIEFDKQTGNFTILSYPTTAQAGQDAFRASLSKDYKTWGLTQVSNLLVLWPPETPPTLSKPMTDKLTAFAVAPYRGGSLSAYTH